MKKSVIKICVVGTLMIASVLCLSGIVQAKEMEEIHLEQTERTLEEGKSTLLLYTVSPAGTDNITEKTWLSHNSGIATVDENGKITAQKEGTTDIDLVLIAKKEDGSDYSQIGKCQVTVSKVPEKKVVKFAKVEPRGAIQNVKEQVQREETMDLPTMLTSIVWAIGLIVILILIGAAYDKKRGKLKKEQKNKEEKKDE